MKSLVRQQFLDQTWDAAHLDAAAKFWLQLYDIAAKRIIHHLVPETPVRTSARWVRSPEIAITSACATGATVATPVRQASAMNARSNLLLEGEGIHGNGGNPALGASCCRNRSGNVHLGHDPATKHVTVNIGVCGHGHDAQGGGSVRERRDVA